MFSFAGALPQMSLTTCSCNSTKSGLITPHIGKELEKYLLLSPLGPEPQTTISIWEEKTSFRPCGFLVLTDIWYKTSNAEGGR